jgi:hypothetical protein
VKKKNYEQANAPLLNYRNAEVRYEQDGNESKIVIYASKIESVSSEGDEQQAPVVNNGYVVKLSNGQFIPDILSGEPPSPTQEENMTELTEVLMEKGLLDEITIPYFPSASRKNCLINDTEFHPDGREMANKSELTNGYFIFTGLNKQAKKGRIEELAGKVDLEVEFLGEW